MGAPKPTLGFPSRTAAALALRADGQSDPQIAKRIGISLNALSGLFASAERLKTAKRAIRPAEVNGRTVLFPKDILDRLVPHATGRGISVNELCRRLVETAVEDGMIDAVLDDQETAA
ncbi:hypothetical protein [Mameliella sp.]|uniref:hypothetical protein n=1 Tax=Mameliella sp. TaxID=1924940 RepID=UPI003BAC5535